MKNDCAITYTVYDIQDFLIYNIDFHRKIGVKHFFVFLDNDNDKFPKELLSAKDVTCKKNINPKKISNKNLDDHYLDFYDKDYNSRRMYNIFWSLMECKKKGIGWISSIDPDELIVCDIKNTSKKNISDFLLTKENKSQIILKTYESLPCNKIKNNSFDSVKEFVPISRIPIFLGEKIRKISNLYEGHSFGKSIFNVKFSNDYFPDVHSWKRIDGNLIKHYLQKEICGNILHYFHYDFETYLNKVKYRSNRSKEVTIKINGNDRKNDIVYDNLSDKDIFDYYKKNILKKTFFKKFIYFFIVKKIDIVNKIISE